LILSLWKPKNLTASLRLVTFSKNGVIAIGMQWREAIFHCLG